MDEFFDTGSFDIDGSGFDDWTESDFCFVAKKAAALCKDKKRGQADLDKVRHSIVSVAEAAAALGNALTPRALTNMLLDLGTLQAPEAMQTLAAQMASISGASPQNEELVNVSKVI